jgi:hypothetical protein
MVVPILDVIDEILVFENLLHIDDEVLEIQELLDDDKTEI